jgi:hypothetical protein
MSSTPSSVIPSDSLSSGTPSSGTPCILLHLQDLANEGFEANKAHLLTEEEILGKISVSLMDHDYRHELAHVKVPVSRFMRVSFVKKAMEEFPDLLSFENFPPKGKFSNERRPPRECKALIWVNPNGYDHSKKPTTVLEFLTHRLVDLANLPTSKDPMVEKFLVCLRYKAMNVATNKTLDVVRSLTDFQDSVTFYDYEVSWLRDLFTREGYETSLVYGPNHTQYMLSIKPILQPQ